MELEEGSDVKIQEDWEWLMKNHHVIRLPDADDEYIDDEYIGKYKDEMEIELENSCQENSSSFQDLSSTENTITLSNHQESECQEINVKERVGNRTNNTQQDSNYQETNVEETPGICPNWKWLEENLICFRLPDETANQLGFGVEDRAPNASMIVKDMEPIAEVVVEENENESMVENEEGEGNDAEEVVQEEEQETNDSDFEKSTTASTLGIIDNSVSPSFHDEEWDKLIARYWGAMKTKHRVGKVIELLNVRLWDGIPRDQADTYQNNYHDSGVLELLKKVWRQLSSRAKVNCSIGCILENKNDGELRYFHSSSNNATVYPKAKLIETEEQLDDFFVDVMETDHRTNSLRQRPNTAWRLMLITNISFYFYKLLGMGKVGGRKKTDTSNTVPPYVYLNRHIRTMVCNSHGVPYNDNLCFFRCLTMQMMLEKDNNTRSTRPDAKVVQKLYKRYLNLQSKDCDGFLMEDSVRTGLEEGVDEMNLLDLEDEFDVKITVFTLHENKTSTVIWCSNSKHENKLYLDLQDRHFSLITNLEGYARAYKCPTCSTCFDRFGNLKRHRCSTSDATDMVFPGGEYKPPATIFNKLREQFGINISTDDPLRYYPYFATYDIECMLPECDENKDTDTTFYTSEHKLLSISICSNVPGFEMPRCIINNGDKRKCVEKFILHLENIAEESYIRVRKNFSRIIERVTDEIQRLEKAEQKFLDQSLLEQKPFRRKLGVSRVLVELEKYMEKLPVLGFNSQSYDINVMKGILLEQLKDISGKDFDFVVKKGTKMPVISIGSFLFLDCTNFIAPGYSYEMYLKAYKCEVAKGFFPYEWMKDLSQLQQKYLPPRKAFYSSLKQKSISEEEYAICQKAWKDNNMSTMRDFLKWYNNLDVTPFVQALERQRAIYREHGIDMLKDGISLPGLALRWMFNKAPQPSPPQLSSYLDFRELGNSFRQTLPICLIDKCNTDLYYLIKKNIVGGPSLVMHRYHEKGLTRIREHWLGKKSKICDRIYGVDANALYLWCMMQSMPTGYPRRRKIENSFVAEPVKFSKVAHSWLQFQMFSKKINIRHQLNGGEVALGQRSLRVDGFCIETRDVFQFHGCFWHGHNCTFNNARHQELHPTRQKSTAQLYRDTMKNEEYLRTLGYTVISIWECEWMKRVKTHTNLQKFVDTFYDSFYPKILERKLNQEEVLERVQSEEFFGFVECDIEVPEDLKDKFSEMSPIFKNTMLSREHLSNEMRNFAETEGFLNTPQRSLVGSLFGEKILLMSPLLKWYLKQGLKITKVYQLIEYIPRNAFEAFGTSVSDARRMGDRDPSQELLANTSKLVGNAAYGKTITDKEKHSKVKYIDGSRKASFHIRGNKFVAMEEISEDFYEIISAKKMLNMNVPVHLGFSILQYAKLRMLQFYYDFMDKYIDRHDFQYVEMDTDSAYMALSGSLETLVKADMKKEFYVDYANWFPRPYCDTHMDEFLKVKIMGAEWNIRDCCEKVLKHGKRTPGLFKEEFTGDGIVALNSKSYYCWGEKGNKFSSKGLNKRSNDLNKHSYLNVLRTRKSFKGTNRGFIMKDGKMLTYRQIKRGLTYFYAKRRVCSDGVSTEPTSA